MDECQTEPCPKLHTRPQPYERRVTLEERSHYGSLIEGLTKARKAKGLSQAAMDERIGVSEGMVAKWEAAHRLPGAFFLMCWCDALGVRLTITKG